MSAEAVTECTGTISFMELQTGRNLKKTGAGAIYVITTTTEATTVCITTGGWI